MPDNIVFVAPNMYVLRNWIATGLADKCQEQLGLTPVFISHFSDSTYKSPAGRKFINYYLPTAEDKRTELPKGFSKLLYYLYYLRLRTFAQEVKNGSIQMMMFSRQRDLVHLLTKAATLLFPRGTLRRSFLRAIVDSINPSHEGCKRLLRNILPKSVIVGSPGIQFLDQIIMIEAKNLDIPAHCVVNSWDNMTSRGPMIRRPDTLMVWNKFMQAQSLEIHQYPPDKCHVVGSLQFCQYEETIKDEENIKMYQRLGLPIGRPYMLYLTGQHVPEYEAEDVQALLEGLEGTRYSELPLVVRIHPQADRGPYKKLQHKKLLLDCPPLFSVKGENGLSLDLAEMRIMAALLKNAVVVYSSWGTTALLEAAIFDRPIIQLRWMNAFLRSRPDQKKKMENFQKYLHLIPFDETGCRIFSDTPESLKDDIEKCFTDNEFLSVNRKRAVDQLAVTPLKEAPQRVVTILAKNFQHLALHNK
jgi:hypothetical protein